MTKTIIAVYGRGSEGKSDTIKRVCQTIIRVFPNAVPSIIEIDYSGDILITITLGKVKIGIESQGDPNSRMISEDTIKKLADKNYDKDLGGCQIIVCATRTEGMTVSKVEEIADEYDYNLIYISSFYGPNSDHNVLNQLAAENIVEVIKSIVIGSL